MNQQQQEEVEIFDIPTSKRNSEETSKSLFSTVFAIIYNFCWGVLFFLFRYYNDVECEQINKWTLYIQIVLFSMAGYKLIIELPIQYKTNGQWKNEMFEVVDYIELFLNLIVLIGLTYAYIQDEECANLRRFVLGYLIVTYFILLLWLIGFISIKCNRDQFNSST